MAHIEPQLGVTHAGSAAGPVAPGAMQHVALNVDSEAALLALRDRLRSNGYWVMGPIDHGMCKSMYLAGLEGLSLEFATSAEPIDADQWLDPEVVALCGIDAAELARYRAPAGFADRGGAVPNPDPHARPGMQVPPEMQTVFSMSDRELAERMNYPTPPVPKRAGG
jgi:hypothetical protein